MTRTYWLVVVAILGIAAALLLPRAESPPPVGTPTPTPVPTVVTTTPAPVTAGPGSLTVRARPARKAFLAGGDDVDVVFDLEARAGTQGDRVPVDLALVLDRSGSMSGEPIRKAREAARQMVQKLTAQDRLALVTFSSDAQVLLTATAMDESGRADANRLIDAIYSDGGTNISGGLDRARQALNGAGRREHAVRRILLLTDGRANSGATGNGLVTLARNFGAEGLRVSTLGLGQDFDEDGLAAMADASGGRYTYLSSEAVIAQALERELAQASRTAASAIRLTLDPASGVTVREVVAYQAEKTGDSLVIGFSDIAEGDSRRVVVRLHAAADHEGAVDLVRARVSYVDVPAGHVPKGAEAVASAAATREDEVVRRSWDSDVAKASLKARWGNALIKSSNDYVNDDMTGATNKLDNVLQEIKAAASAMSDKAFADEYEQTRTETVAEMASARESGGKYSKAKALKNFGRDSAGF